MNRILQVVLNGTNRLSPVLDRAGRDVDEYTRRAERANDRLSESSRRTTEQQRRDGEQQRRSNEQNTQSAEEASRKIGAIRQQMTDVSRNRVQVGMDTTEARLELARLQAQLDEVATKTPTARVKAETAGAEAQLRAVQSQLNRIDGQTVHAQVDVDDAGTTAKATTEINRLMAGALAISPALGSIGAVAVAGLGVIAPMAAGAAAGLGVLALGLHGVTDTVKLLTQRDQAAAVSSARGAGTQVSSARAISAAQQSLANTRADAADAAVRASERVAGAQRDEAKAVEQSVAGVQAAIRGQQQAEQDLSREQRGQRQAQLDLIAARKDAQQQLEDLSASVTDNVLAQRQSVLDVADAQRALEAARGNPNAAADSVERLSIAYEEQLSRQRQLATQGRRLAADQDEANRAGVEGSAQVVAAQQKLADANLSVQDATVKAGDAAVAVDQARRDGAQKVADAQQAVSTAIREQAAQQRQAAYSIAQAQRAVQDASASAGAAGVSAYSAVDDQLAQVNPATRKFAEYVKGTLQPAFQGLQATAAAGLLPGVQGAADELMQYLPRVDSLVGRLSTRLGGLAVEGAKSLGDPVWQRFFDMIDRDAGPMMDDFFHTLENVGEGFAGIVTAFAPMARDVGGGIRDLSKDFRDWGSNLGDSEGFRRFTQYVAENWPKVRDTVANVADVVEHLIEAGAPIGSAFLTGFQLLSAVLSALPVPVVEALLAAFIAFKGASAVVGIVNGVADGFARLSKARENVGQFADRVGEVNERIGGLRGAASGAMGVLGGPWGIALSAAGFMVGTLSSQMSDASATTDKWTQALITGGNAAAQAMQQYKAQRNKEPFQWMANLDEWTGLHSSMKDATQAAEDYYRSLGPVQEAQARAAHWQEELSYRIEKYGKNSPEAEAAQRRYAYWTGVAGDRQHDLDNALGNTVQSLSELTDGFVTQSQADAGFAEATARAKGALEGLNGRILDGAGNLDTQTEAGRKVQDVLFGVRDAGNNVIETMIKHGATTDEVTAKDAELRQSFIDTAVGMGISKEAAKNLADQIYGIPTSRSVYIDANTDTASEKIKGWMDDIKSKGLVGLFSFGHFGQQQSKAFGGTIEGYSPHERADNIPVMATAGEFMQPVPAVRRYGTGFMEDVRSGRFPVSLARGYASGGLIGGMPYEQSDNPADLLHRLTIDVDQLPTGGTAGNGQLGSTWGSIWYAVHAAIPEARQNSTYRPGDSGYHGKNKAIDFGFGSGPGGAGSAGLASIARFLYTGFGQTLAELIYDGIGDDTPDMKNGVPHVYDATTRSQHTNHVHAAVRDNGGWLPQGLSMVYNGTGGNENAAILTNTQWDALQVLASRAAALPAGGGGIDYGQLAAALSSVGAANVEANVRVFLGDRELTDIVRISVDSRLRDTAKAARAAGAR